LSPVFPDLKHFSPNHLLDQHSLSVGLAGLKFGEITMKEIQRISGHAENHAVIFE
jgi:hypothetical protein